MDTEKGFYVIAGGRRFVPTLPLKGALHLAEDLVEVAFEQALIVSEDGAVTHLVGRQYDS